MSILENAVDSIAIGVEDFQSKDPKRLVSSVRNLFAGVLLLIKHQMVEVAGGDETVIASKVLPSIDGEDVVWSGKGHATVDVHGIIERCEELGIVVQWKALKHLQTHRNMIEHSDYPKSDAAAIRSYLSDCFVLLRNFIVAEMKQEPVTVLGSSTWSKLMEEHTFYETEKNVCSGSLEALSWSTEGAKRRISSMQCEVCGSGLIRSSSVAGTDAESSEFVCSNCGDKLNFEGALEHAVFTVDFAREHRRMKDGEGPLVGTCPACGREGFDAEERACVYCSQSGPYHCALCDNEIPIEELFQNVKLCSWCEQVRTKND